MVPRDAPPSDATLAPPQGVRPTAHESDGEAPLIAMVEDATLDLRPELPSNMDAPSAPGIPKAPVPRALADWTMFEARRMPVKPTPAAAAESGEVLPTRYEDLGVIGHGGMGEVHRVRDRELGRTLAMKFIHPELLTSRSVVARFMEEAQVTAQLQHPGVVPVYDLGVLPDQRAYFTMKEIVGRTLGDVIHDLHAGAAAGRDEAGGGWTFRRLIDAFHKVCETVSYAHARGVIHRDLKPTNIMVGDFGEVMVADWGLAKVVGLPESAATVTLEPVSTVRSRDEALATRAGGIAGTPAYMPPEQARGESHAVGPRSDVYALGAILYEILTGAPPYDGPTAESVLAQVLDGPPPPPRARALRIPDELAALCTRAMAHASADRFPDAGHLASELAAWLDGARKREQALRLVDQASALLPEMEHLRRVAGSLHQEASRLLARVRPHDPVERKRRGWAMQDEADRLEWQAALKEVELTQLLGAALNHAPDLAQAHDMLAAQYRARHAAAEAQRDRLAAAHYLALLRRHDSGRHATYLRGDGTLTVWTDPPGAEVELCVFERVERRLEAVPFRMLGRTPIHEVSLPMGSYLLRIRSPGRQEVVYPVQIGREEHWDGVPPGASDSCPIMLPRRDLLSPDDCYVPAGWAWVGGDPEAPGALPKRRVWVDAFVLRRFPVTNQAYVGFLNHLVANGREDEAQRHVPRERSGNVRDQGAPIYGRNAAGRFVLRQDADGFFWGPTWPVASIEHASARAFAAWLASTTGVDWRLPSELEWEKAARGVDGRFFPWGDLLDPTWCNMADTNPGRPAPAPVDTFPSDESPYGVQGLAGNVRDWCLDRWTNNGPEELSGPDPVDDPSVLRVARGGCWDGGGFACRSAARVRVASGRRGPDIGIRLARTLSGTG